MAVWLCMPSARPDGGTIQQWRAKGYRAAIWRDPGAPSIDVEVLIEKEYPGYGAACNFLARAAFAADPACQWIVCAGDDTEPAAPHPDVIAFECGRHFGVAQDRYRDERTIHTTQGAAGSAHVTGRFPWSTFGVMQPTGDRFAGGSIDRIAGSPWIGREFCLRTYNGEGPYNPAYRHMFVDEELFNVANRLNCYWARPDLTHLHHHFMRQSTDVNSPAISRPVPDHLKEANSQRHWDIAKGIFLDQKSKGFPLGTQLLPPEHMATPAFLVCHYCGKSVLEEELHTHETAHRRAADALMKAIIPESVEQMPDGSTSFRMRSGTFTGSLRFHPERGIIVDEFIELRGGGSPKEQN